MLDALEPGRLITEVNRRLIIRVRILDSSTFKALILGAKRHDILHFAEIASI